jgi:hypothetical protein
MSRDIYEEALLQDVRWDELNPFRSVSWTHLRSPSSWCPGSPTVHTGDDLRDRVAAGEVKCYRFRAEPGGLVTFDVDSSQPQQYDLELTLYDASGNRIDRDSTSGGRDPRLTSAFQQGGTYYIQLTGRGFSGDAPYSFLVHDGIGEPALDAAQRLPVNSRIRDSITQASQLEIETFGWIGYGHVYYFDGQANQRIVLDVFADSINSDLDAQVQLFDRRLQSLGYDRGGGWGSDAQLSQTLRETGRYYVLVTDEDQGYGSLEDFFYEILLTIQ